MVFDGDVGAAYGVVAADYEERFIDELDMKPRDRQLLDAITVRGQGLVVDIGCGPGQIGARIRRSGRPVIGLDVSPAMAVRAGRRLDAAVVGTMLQLPFGDGQVGDITAFYSVIHLPRTQLRDAYREFKRVLAPGGHALVSAHEGTGEVEVADFLGHSVRLAASFFTLDELTDAATAAGLEVVLAERRDPYEHEGSTVRLYVEAARRA